MTTAASAAATIDTSAGFLVEPRAGAAYWGAGEHLVRKVGAAQVGGAFMMYEVTVVPGGGPPPHVHTREDEAFYVLDGEMEFLVGDRIVPGPVGTFVWAPRGTVHQFRARGGPARFLLLVTPGKLEEMFMQFCTPVKSGETEPPPMNPDLPARVVEIATRDYAIGFAFGADATERATPAPRRGVWVLGSHVTFLADGKDTNGQLCIVEVVAPPEAGPPPHFHHEQSETFYVVEGEFTVTLGDRTVVARAGATVHVPAGVVHAFRNTGATRGRVLSIHHTAGMEHFFQECGVEGQLDAMPHVGLPDPERMIAILKKHGMGIPGVA